MYICWVGGYPMDSAGSWILSLNSGRRSELHLKFISNCKISGWEHTYIFLFSNEELIWITQYFSSLSKSNMKCLMTNQSRIVPATVHMPVFSKAKSEWQFLETNDSFLFLLYSLEHNHSRDSVWGSVIQSLCLWVPHRQQFLFVVFPYTMPNKMTTKHSCVRAA